MYAGEQDEFLFKRSRLAAIPRDLGADDVRGKLFDALAETKAGNSFLEWFGQVAGSHPRFDLRIGGSEWSIPWELLIARLQLRRDRRGVAFTRRVGWKELAAPSEAPEKLRTLLLLGDDNPPGGPALQLDREADTVRVAWSQLDHSAKSFVDEPIVERVNEDTITERVELHKPHVILYSGHGSASSIQMADGRWLKANHYANAVCRPTWKPIYAGFWACSTARPNPSASGLAEAPTFAVELLRRGIVAVLAMQSPIGDTNAILLARIFFEEIAAGRTMERAIAEARAELFDRTSVNTKRLDWASPVVWTASDAVSAIQWNSPGALLIQRQLAGRRMIAAAGESVAAPAEETGPPKPLDADVVRARSWIRENRMWISGDVTDALVRDEWIRALAALQGVDVRAVIAIEMSNSTPEALASWAERVLASSLPGDLSDDVAAAFREIPHAAQRGWKRLCDIGQLVFAISGDLPADTETWFWDCLGDPKIPVMILCCDRGPLGGQTWSVDSLGAQMTQQRIDEAISAAPRLSRALAMLNAPIADELVAIEPCAEPRTLAEWPEGRVVLVELPSGIVLKSDARRRILDRADAQERAQAHYDAAALLGSPGLRLTPEIRRRRAIHLLRARSAVRPEFVPELNEKFAIEADRLLWIYRQSHQPRAVLDVYQTARAAYARIEDLLLPTARLNLAWAYLRLGKVTYAKHWAARAHPRELLDIAYKHGLVAEMLKSDEGAGARQAVLDEISYAIAACERALRASHPADHEAMRAQTALRAYEQDRARIQHFLFDDTEKAKQEYERLLKEWADQPLAMLDIAIIKRNYAEVLRRGSSAPDDGPARKARREIEEALNIARHFPDSQALAEIEYEAARDAHYRQAFTDEKHHLALAIDVARRSGNDMVRAIAENRLFWAFDVFSSERWHSIAEQLGLFPSHGWAVRTLIDGSLCAANILLERDDRAAAAFEIDCAKTALDPHPLFTGASDRSRRAAIAAGYTMVADPNAAGIWQEFMRTAEWVAGWMAERNVSTAESAWRQRVAETCQQRRGA
jgi:hypothetical protein